MISKYESIFSISLFIYHNFSQAIIRQLCADKRVDFDFVDSMGKTALDVAIENNNLEAQYLITNAIAERLAERFASSEEWIVKWEGGLNIRKSVGIGSELVRVMPVGTSFRVRQPQPKVKNEYGNFQSIIVSSGVQRIQLVDDDEWTSISDDKGHVFSVRKIDEKKEQYLVYVVINYDAEKVARQCGEGPSVIAVTTSKEDATSIATSKTFTGITRTKKCSVNNYTDEYKINFGSSWGDWGEGKGEENNKSASIQKVIDEKKEKKELMYVVWFNVGLVAVTTSKEDAVSIANTFLVNDGNDYTEISELVTECKINDYTEDEKKSGSLWGDWEGDQSTKKKQAFLMSGLMD